MSSLEDSDKSLLLNAFNTQLFEFMEDMQIVIVDDPSIKKAKLAFSMIKKTNPALLIKIWNNYISSKYETEINNNNINSIEVYNSMGQLLFSKKNANNELLIEILQEVLSENAFNLIFNPTETNLALQKELQVSAGVVDNLVRGQSVIKKGDIVGIRTRKLRSFEDGAGI